MAGGGFFLALVSEKYGEARRLLLSCIYALVFRRYTFCVHG
jgi:hypothetical protein